MKTFPLFLSLLTAPALHASQRSSADYTISAETLDSGGQAATSADYSMLGSMGQISGSSSVNSGGLATLAHSGFIGEIYELLGYGLLTSNFYPSEEGSTQIIPVRTADDGTNLVIPTTGFIFSVLEGPLTDISEQGFVTTGKVYESTLAKVGATSDLFAGQLELPLYVQDTLTDNYGLYAADGLPDAWQKQYFGLENPLAAPLLDPDSDGQNNRFEYTAGIIPIDPLSHFIFRIEQVPGEPTHMNLKFSPTLPDRTYIVKSNTTLTDGIWLPLENGTTANDGDQRTVTDSEATTATKFYQVEIIAP